MSGQHLKLKGQMMLLADQKHLIYICSPYVTSINELLQYGMRLTGEFISRKRGFSYAAPRRYP